MAYTTVEEVLQRMGHAASESGDLQTKIADAIPAAETSIDGDTGRHFEPVARTIVFGAEDPYVLAVPDLVSVTSVKVDDDDDGVYETTIDSSGYELDTYRTAQTGWPYELVRLLDRTWPTGGKRRNRIEIVGSWGWSAVPAPINQAATLLCLRVAQRPSAALFGVQSFGDLGASYVRRDDPDYMHLIGQYVRPQIA